MILQKRIIAGALVIGALISISCINNLPAYGTATGWKNYGLPTYNHRGNFPIGSGVGPDGKNYVCVAQPGLWSPANKEVKTAHISKPYQTTKFQVRGMRSLQPYVWDETWHNFG